MQYFHEMIGGARGYAKDELVSKEYEANLAMDAVASLLASVRDVKNPMRPIARCFAAGEKTAGD